MPRTQTYSMNPTLDPWVKQAFDELEPILNELADRMVKPHNPLARPLIKLFNWAGRVQMKLGPRR